jgi:tetratricopeptide (TPR) repeat protein
VITLGYEGFANCVGQSFCGIAVSPVAGDHTILHELAHLWSDLYSERWLSEGFAEFIASETAARMPPGLVTGQRIAWSAPEVELQLDDWGPVNVSIGLSEEKQATENAGYYRAERFILLLQAELGLATLQRANAALAESTSPADSREYMDALEDASSRNNDALFREWVFASSHAKILSQRREARDRLTNLIARAQEEELSDKVPAQIETQVLSWNFTAALPALDEAEAALESYLDLKEDLASVRREAEPVGLTISGRVDEAIQEWDFERAREIVEDAEQALAFYLAAREKVDEPRNIWQQFGLLGSDPERDLADAAAAFNSGDYDEAKTLADDAIDAIDGAAGVAARRVLIVAVGAAIFALIILAIVWYTRRPDRRPEPG